MAYASFGLVGLVVFAAVSFGTQVVQELSVGQEAPPGRVHYARALLALLCGAALTLSALGFLWLTGARPPAGSALALMPQCLIGLSGLCAAAWVWVARYELRFDEGEVQQRTLFGTKTYALSSLRLRKASKWDGWEVLSADRRHLFALTPTMLGVEAFVDWAHQARVRELRAEGDFRPDPRRARRRTPRASRKPTAAAREHAAAER
ncbi:MAG: hypothetical protein AB7N76_35550 [Planctomycetota bacterium]